jgi:hypothetical protein
LSTALIDTGDEAINFGNVDSYAKYLYHVKEEKKLSQLKLALTYYFTYNQICKRTSLNERRYLNFITSLINDKHEFPSHVKILNWNYDYLLELESSIYNTSFDQEISKGKPIINSFPFVGYEFNKPDDLKIGTEISHVHLNGIAGFYSEKIEDNGNKVFKSIFDETNFDTLADSEKIIEEKFIEAFHNKYISQSQLITFAWEKESEAKSYLKQILEAIKEVCKDTEYLVVIGYSFPF